jgi:hypothetical protein
MSRESCYPSVVKGLLLPSLGCAVLLALAAIPSPADIAPEFKEEGVLYFDGNLPNKVVATIRVVTTVYIGRDFQMALGSFNPGQDVEILGMSPAGYLLKGKYRNNTITGWIRPEDLPTGVDTSLFAQAKKNQERHNAVAVAIANKSVIQGMTPEEVVQALGRPSATSSRTDAKGSMTVLTFTTYVQQPQYSYTLDGYGHPYLQTSYVKIPVGQIIVSFADGVVVAVETQKNDPNSPGVVTN